MLEHTINSFNGVVIDPDALSITPSEFQQRLQDALRQWKEDGRQLVWLDIPRERARLIPPAMEFGFDFHHTAETHLSLVFRLRPDALVPSFATHFIGAGGVVLNDRRELLVVSERFRRDRSRPYYKLPGGALHPGEHLADAVVREVFEETGVRARFESLACFRHWHGYRFGKSDIYFVCRLSPVTEQIVIQQAEIEESKWMPVDDYLESEYVGEFNRTIVRSALDAPVLEPCCIEGHGDPDRLEFFMPNGRPAPSKG